jgi:hypothetical protein
MNLDFDIDLFNLPVQTDYLTDPLFSHCHERLAREPDCVRRSGVSPVLISGGYVLHLRPERRIAPAQ